MLLGWNSNWNFRLSRFFLNDDGSEADPDSSCIIQDHVFFISRYAAVKYARSRLHLSDSQFLVRKVDSERWTLHLVLEISFDDLLIPDYNDAVQ